jgi:hypothetical protein
MVFEDNSIYTEIIRRSWYYIRIVKYQEEIIVQRTMAVLRDLWYWKIERYEGNYHFSYKPLDKIDLLRVLSHKNSKMIGLILWLTLHSLYSFLSLEWSINYPCYCVCLIGWLIVFRHNWTTMRMTSTKACNVRNQEGFSTSLKDYRNPYVLIGWALKKVMLLYPTQTQNIGLEKHQKEAMVSKIRITHP